MDVPGWYAPPGEPVREDGRMDRHAFEQNPDATQVRVCRCGNWPDHHVHTGDRGTCGCDACRTARGD